MAAKKPAAKPATTAVAQRAQVQLPAEVQEQMAADIAAFQQRMSAPTGNRIAVTQDKKFRNAGGDKFDAMSGVIVDFVAKKAFYEGAYDKDNIVPPNCFTCRTCSTRKSPKDVGRMPLGTSTFYSANLTSRPWSTAC